ncbi:MAG: EamA-like transporter family protein [Alphaproteobacteria bacterium]|jgi:transporter family-2 protein|nr:EamA-like transporter family protein [Alphaproteobacteria bacterium]
MNVGTLLVFATILAGAMIASQGIINGRMAVHMGGPVQAALISFSVGWMVLLALNLALGHDLPVREAAAAAPWWAWLGGFMGAVVVTLAATAVPRIGVATYVSAFIAGQLTAAIFYDHFGILGQAVREITWPRLIGVIFMGLGVYLIRRF